MNVLSPELRKRLERVVTSAREVAETGARAALEALAVHVRDPYGHMSSENRTLRRRLRAHGRQLGDWLNARSGAQSIDRLVHECAYEWWHGMLFARFLSENHLLIAPDWGDVSVSLQDCEDLGKDEDVDKWTMAIRFAHEMLPQVFRPAHPAFEVQFAREHRRKLEGLLESLPTDIFIASDSLGWVYQFWQSKKKDEVNRSEVKIGANELPAVTQLFTEPYMVAFLLDNTLGAWWAARQLSDSDWSGARSEAELRHGTAIPGVSLDYLRFARQDDRKEHEESSSRSEVGPRATDAETRVAQERLLEPACTVEVDLSGNEHQQGAGPIRWRPAAGVFDGWPEHLGELKVLDPCCGSGHFLVAVFLMLVPMRMTREGLLAPDAVDAVLRENLHGLELDPRCVELAAFSLALAAWTYPGAGGYRPLPELNLACSGLSVGADKKSWTELAAGRRNLRIALDWLHDAFEDAPILGSLLDPAATKAAKLVDWRDLSVALAQALDREESDTRREAALAARGLARTAELLARRYHWVVTNVPYLARGKHGEKLRAFCTQQYADAKNDLATVFLERCLELCTEGGTAGLVLPQNWLFLKSYRKLREKLLKGETWRLLARLGPGAFETISGEVVKAILLTLSRGRSASRADELFDDASAASTMRGLDVSESRTAGEKDVQLRKAEIKDIGQAQQLKNPDARVALESSSHETLLEGYALVPNGMHGGDSRRFRFLFWEISFGSVVWRHFQTSVDATRHYGGREHVFFWPDDGHIHYESPSAYVKGRVAWRKRGVVTRVMKELPVTLYDGKLFDISCVPVVPRDPAHLSAIWCYCSSPEYHDAVRRIDQKLNVTNATLGKVPFDLERWARIAEESYPNGLPQPYSDDPTQWIFHGHPCGSVVWDDARKRTANGSLRRDPTVLQVAVARLLGYRWPAEHDAGMELADEQRAWVRRCEALLSFADEDGIVCIPPVRGEAPAGDRLLGLLVAAFGDAWDDGVLTKLLAKAGASSLDEWLRSRFFDEHCKLFHQRPFIWHIWDGRRRDGFHALVSYHKLAEGDRKGRQLLESLTYSYLGDWIARQEDGVERGESGAEDRLVAARELKKRLAGILQGEPPFDIFVRWKPIHEQPIGWEPDVDDGVRLNIRPFMADDVPGGKKGAGILRTKPKITWGKDRGKEALKPIRRSKPPWLQDDEVTDFDEDHELRPREHYPWFWNCPGDGTSAERTDFSGGRDFDGNRWNDLHYTNAMKSAAREREQGSDPRVSGRVRGRPSPGRDGRVAGGRMGE